MQMVCLDAPQDLAKEKLALSADHCSKPSRPITRELDALLLRSLIKRHFDGYVEMSEEDTALFWRLDIPTDLVAGEENAGHTLESTEASPAEGLCLETTTLPEQAKATNTPTVASVGTRGAVV